ncbi:MAG: restriction endonuclease [Dehalococcoidia bacterium]|nr:restriction endonuclease [Dehalococcoidia bacterium]
MVQVFPYESLSTADLIVDAIYEGQEGGQLAGEPLSHLLAGIGNLGGFRSSGKGEDKNLVVLNSSGEDRDWPDTLDLSTGRFFYYGDNKRPGHDLHTTHKGGNRILRRVFDMLHGDPPIRNRIPPFLIFTKHSTRLSARSFQFRGLAVPGYPNLPATEDLIAIWKTTDGNRFQNYLATFSILDVPRVTRAWLDDLRDGNQDSRHRPLAWKDWVDTGSYAILKSEGTITIRERDAQLPDSPTKCAILEVVWEHFQDQPTAFEAFAARLYGIHDQRVIIDEVTRTTRDGGRDAYGRYLLGLHEDPIYAEFSLEAKCYRPPLNGERGHSVGVRQVARLISRIRHRQFGVLVTTSYVGRQAYEEIREDRHPIVFICGKDIVDILTTSGLNTPAMVKSFLIEEFPLAREAANGHD